MRVDALGVGMVYVPGIEPLLDAPAKFSLVPVHVALLPSPART